MKTKVRRIIELLAVLAGISGLSIGDMRSVYPKFFYLSLVFLIIVFIYLLFSYRANQYNAKKTINQVWQDLLSGAARSIHIFAGDASWSTRDQQVLAARTAKGIEVRLLCRSPGPNQLLQDHVKRLIASGCEVRFYFEGKDPGFRGIIAASENENESIALMIRKTPKKEIERKYGVPGDERLYSYSAQRLLSTSDAVALRAVRHLYEYVWDVASIGFLLDTKKLSAGELVELLRLVPHYSAIDQKDVELRSVGVSSMRACCDTVKEYKLHGIRSLLAAMHSQRISGFEVFSCRSYLYNGLLLPPIVERHGASYVLIDGTHRAYCWNVYFKEASVRCLVVNCSQTLPAKPVPLAAVKVRQEKLPREVTFNRYRSEHFRDLSELKRRLESISAMDTATSQGERTSLSVS
jgi:hypothetical protein